MVRVLVSACLLGEPVRYDGRALPSPHPVLRRWQAERRVVSFCPECAGGLPVPRTPAEIVSGRVLTRDNRDVTPAFLAGARQALAAARAAGARLAVLQDRSPSCGSTLVHDGSFTGRLRPGAGLTSGLLRRHGIEVFSDTELERAESRLREIENALQ